MIPTKLLCKNVIEKIAKMDFLDNKILDKVVSKRGLSGDYF